MHYYQHNIGDFRRDTMHLTLLEHGVYRQLLDLYYLNECELDANAMRLVCARNAEEMQTVENILNEFFIKTENGWFHKRCHDEIANIKKLKKSHWGTKLPKHIRTSIQSKRNASKVNATPKWLTKEHSEEIEFIYLECAIRSASSGIKYEVDHIIPLRSKLVCGLHVPWNLRVIESYKNRQKSNLFEVV